MWNGNSTNEEETKFRAASDRVSKCLLCQCVLRCSRTNTADELKPEYFSRISRNVRSSIMSCVTHLQSTTTSDASALYPAASEEQQPSPWTSNGTNTSKYNYLMLLSFGTYAFISFFAACSVALPSRSAQCFIFNQFDAIFLFLQNSKHFPWNFCARLFQLIHFVDTIWYNCKAQTGTIERGCVKRLVATNKEQNR